MVGYGNFLPVDESFRVARQMNTGLSKVGCVWNNAESNSEAYTHKAREVCRDLGITLLEANVNNSADVQEAAQSLVGRGARAIWVGGDATVLSALDSVLAVARKASIPVFSILPGKPERGTLFDVGVDFFEVGRRTGILAADVLSGADPASLPIVDVLDRVPRRLLINQQALRDLTDTWRIPDALLRQAEVVVDEQGVPKKKK
jgi:putative ABC transport system substrate-binding protein